ncbi:PREDICTED: DNA polymerase delta subunit 3-like [Ceratosolen solmsi marchali]|uniref:DNA polymerase delta subunit 3 n=1 Tax=Ceratosolen solmsi marchali TaxID=326594 RepID=A0AAJ6YQV8_9HYME|nr:PREDICTED: DNA polymerase delta subunit 3-like [Ceratosolen solmsi marchali]
MSLINYENTLKSYIQDDNKLVTYKWLSKELKIHVNIAKNILKQYWEKYRNDKNIIATFLLVGPLHDRSIHVAIVKDSNLNNTKQKFIYVDCEHLYSLQKSLNDIELLTLTDEGDFHYSAIKYNSNILKNNEIHSFYHTGISRNKKHVSNEFNSSYSSFKNVIKNETIKKEIFEEMNGDLINNLTSLEYYKKTKIPIQLSKPGSNAFSENKSQISNIVQDSSNNEWKNSEHAFSMELHVSKKADLKLYVKNDNVIQKEKDNINLQFEKNISNTSKNKFVNDQFNSKNCIKKNEPPKRKRIIIDSSEDEFSNNDDKEENEQVEQVLKVRNKSPIIQSKILQDNKHITKKIIDKTFKDEDGYLITKRVHIYEDSNDNDKYIKNKKEEFHKSKSVEVKAKKQTTLKYFFKKS